jgi:hypothetical protein
VNRQSSDICLLLIAHCFLPSVAEAHFRAKETFQLSGFAALRDLRCASIFPVLYALCSLLYAFLGTVFPIFDITKSPTRCPLHGVLVVSPFELNSKHINEYQEV